MSEKYLKTKDGSIEDVVKTMQNKVLESDYQNKFNQELEKAGKSLGQDIKNTSEQKGLMAPPQTKEEEI